MRGSTSCLSCHGLPVTARTTESLNTPPFPTRLSHQGESLRGLQRKQKTVGDTAPSPQIPTVRHSAGSFTRRLIVLSIDDLNLFITASLRVELVVLVGFDTCSRLTLRYQWL
jgi:hypothetical protein